MTYSATALRQILLRLYPVAVIRLLDETYAGPLPSGLPVLGRYLRHMMWRMRIKPTWQAWHDCDKFARLAAALAVNFRITQLTLFRVLSDPFQ